MDATALTHIRKYLHQNPELSNREKNTAKFILNKLKLTKPSLIKTKIGGTGILAQYSGQKPGKHIMLRCELDALPIVETNKFKHKSRNKNVSHKCGHDGHMTILLGVAKYLFENPLKKGTISLLFQPAEETGMGAKQVIADKTFQAVCTPDHVLALHNYPKYPMGAVIIKPGVFTGSVVSCKITLTGKTSHAAEPENGINPSYAIAEILTQSKSLQQTATDSPDFGLLTPIYTNIGHETYGTSAGFGSVGFTIRSWSDSKNDFLKKSIEEITKKEAKKYNLTSNINWFEDFSSVENDPSTVGAIAAIAKQLGLKVIETNQPFKWGEDFGLFTQKYSGALFCIGAGEKTPALHNPDYDFPDQLTPLGVNMFINTAINLIQ